MEHNNTVIVNIVISSNAPMYIPLIKSKNAHDVCIMRVESRTARNAADLWVKQLEWHYDGLGWQSIVPTVNCKIKVSCHNVAVGEDYLIIEKTKSVGGEIISVSQNGNEQMFPGRTKGPRIASLTLPWLITRKRILIFIKIIITCAAHITLALISFGTR